MVTHWESPASSHPCPPLFQPALSLGTAWQVSFAGRAAGLCGKSSPFSSIVCQSEEVKSDTAGLNDFFNDIVEKKDKKDFFHIKLTLCMMAEHPVVLFFSKALPSYHKIVAFEGRKWLSKCTQQSVLETCMFYLQLTHSQFQTFSAIGCVLVLS